MEWFYDLVLFVLAALYLAVSTVAILALIFTVIHHLFFYNPAKDPGVPFLTGTTALRKPAAPTARSARQSRCDCTKSEKG